MQKLEGLHGWIDSLPEPERLAVEKAMKVRRYTDGQAIYLMGETGEELFRIVSGKVRHCVYASSGKEVQVAELRRGDCFGELSLITGLCRANCAFSVGDTELAVLHQRHFEQLYQTYPAIPIELNRLLARRLLVAYTLYEDVCLLPLRDRLTRLLSRLASSQRSESDAQSALVQGVTHEQLARMLGSTRQAVTREIKLLEKAGLIQSSYGKLVIHNVHELVLRSDQLGGSELLVPDYSG